MRVPFAIALLLAAPLARADAPKAADAEKVAASSLEALAKADWKAYAELMHPDSLAAFRKQIVPALQAADKAGKVNADVLAIFGGAKDVETVVGWKPEKLFVEVM